MNDQWTGITPAAREQLTQRDYRVDSLGGRLSTIGVEIGELIAAGSESLVDVWIPGVELFPRKIYPQRHRGFFGEMARQDEGQLAGIGLWPRQWATARMYANTAKGFHIHPPYIPSGENPQEWFQRLFVIEPTHYALRPYDREQWDVMFFVQGVAEMILVDERVGMERRVMRFILEGDDHRGQNNAAVVIPPGVAHALRVEGSADVIMVYGTSTRFDPTAEGRIASGIESAPLPSDWDRYLK